MNYTKIHDQLIGRAQIRQVIYPLTCYTENHHIIPKSMGGSNSKSNMVRLTAREHYLVHYLLYKIHSNRKTAAALWYMTVARNEYTTNRYQSKSYQYARLALSITVKNRSTEEILESNKKSAQKRSTWTEEEKNKYLLKQTEGIKLSKQNRTAEDKQQTKEKRILINQNKSQEEKDIIAKKISESVKKMYAARTSEEQKNISEKISKSNKKYHEKKR